MTTTRQDTPTSNTLRRFSDDDADTLSGPNPFVGFRVEDIVATARQIGAQAIQHPELLFEQKASLAADLFSVLTGQAESAPPNGDKRFADPAWRDDPLYRMSLQSYLAWRKALTAFVDRSALDQRSKERAQFVMSVFTEAVSSRSATRGLMFSVLGLTC
ncbi:poly(hydroxyalkanoate) polymerase-like protein [Paraburkholderia sp. BL8N3]|nr:hypothetical protein [Paraburkholderia sp. BL8N3]TCK33744.1 poly(hydroxyalkanoate) polymerase-like protein [Paraburkholderia sp. BL8N3]